MEEVRSRDRLYKVSSIIRFHDIGNLGYLARAVASLHGQTGVSVTPIIVLQRFDDAQVRKVKSFFDDNWYFPHHGAPVIENCKEPSHGDIRSALLNKGLSCHFDLQNRYLSFLDHDDILYGHAYALLANEIEEMGVVFAFGGIEVAKVKVFGEFDFIYEKDSPFRGGNKIDLVKDNFCPIHSYLVDTDKVEKSELYFREDLSRVEDYEFLLRVAGRYPCSFRKINSKIGLYFIRSDGSNTTPTGLDGEDVALEKANVWHDNVSKLNSYRSAIEIRLYASDFV